MVISSGVHASLTIQSSLSHRWHLMIRTLYMVRILPAVRGV